MADPQVLTTLRAKQAEIETYIADCEKRLGQARADLAHVNATIRLFETTRDETTQFPVYARLAKIFARGELLRLCREAIGASPDGALDTRQLAAHVMAAKGFDATDKALAVSITAKVTQTMDEAARRRRTFERAGKRSGVNVWRVALSLNEAC
jgi:hypothetical protein